MKDRRKVETAEREHVSTKFLSYKKHISAKSTFQYLLVIVSVRIHDHILLI